MIAPEVRRGGNGETGRPILLRNNLLVSALIFCALELWRPCFFLTDDNLDGGLPFFHEMGRHLLAGRSPFFSDYIFGGHYNLLRDPIFFAWHPLYFVVSLLTATPLHFWVVDAAAFVLLMLATAGFANLAWFLRSEQALTLSDGWLMFYTMSFLYSMIALTTGASWLTFLGNLSALPWLALGILVRAGWRGTALIGLFEVHQILGGHLEPTISTNIFFTVFALAVSCARGSALPLRSWLVGNVVALVVVSPLLYPALQGFLSSARSHGVDLSDMQANNIPARDFPTSVFLGMALWLVHPPDANLTATYTVAVGSCAAAWCIVPTLAGRKWTRLEGIVFGMVALFTVLIIRPQWISEIMIRLPLLKSMRWPFREFLQFQFFFHLFLLLRTPAKVPRWQFLFALLSVGLYLPPMLLHEPPTFASMDLDRRILFSGAFDSYWKKVRTELRPGDQVAVIIPVDLYLDDRLQKPYSLLGTYSYAMMARFVNVWGWSQTPPEDQYAVHIRPLYVFGAYPPIQIQYLLKEAPHLRFITLQSLQPLKITLSAPGGDIDLTPFVPAALSTPQSMRSHQLWAP